MPSKGKLKLKPPTFVVCRITACSQEGMWFLGFKNGADMEGGKS